MESVGSLIRDGEYSERVDAVSKALFRWHRRFDALKRTDGKGRVLH